MANKIQAQTYPDHTTANKNLNTYTNKKHIQKGKQQTQTRGHPEQEGMLAHWK
jgi:hypothetical protein